MQDVGAVVLLSALTGAGVAFVMAIFVLPGMDFLFKLTGEAFFRARTNWLIRRGIISIEHRQWEFTGIDAKTGDLKMREVVDLKDHTET